jgi:hypothetical protein
MVFDVSANSFKKIDVDAGQQAERFASLCDLVCSS